MNSLFLDTLKNRVLIFDGAMGTALQARDLPLSDYNNLENCSEVINLTRPDVVESIHRAYFEIGCDAVETNTFGGMKHVLAEFDLQDRCREINRTAAEIACRVRDEFSTSSRPRFVVGSLGPGTKLPTLRQITFDALVDSYAEQARGLLEGGVDVLCIETCQDILQAKAVLCAVLDVMNEQQRELPLMVQVTMEAFGTMLLGTEVGAAVSALEAYPEINVIGFNCATGPQEMSEHVRYLSHHCSRYLSVLPNAGLPQLVDGKPHYTLTPSELAKWLSEFVEVDGVNIVGGCCGTTPEHLAAVIEAVGERAPKGRDYVVKPSVSSVYSAAPLKQDTSFLIIGERTNTNGSRRFKQLLNDSDYDGMVQMGREQIKEGAHVLDVCGAYVGRDEIADMNEIVGRFATEISIPLSIDSTEPEVIEESLKLAGGRCIINSVNLEDGEGKLDRVCRLARRYGSALIALTIDEQGMAKDAARKLEIAKRIYNLCTQRHGLAAHDLIYDTLTFTICTGNEDDRKLAAETLAAIRQVKTELPGVFTVLGVSNISFGLLPAARATLNSVFLHHAIEHGLDAAIVHVAGITPYFKIPDRQRQVAEDLIYDRRQFDGNLECTYDPLKELIKLFSDDGAKKKKRKKPADVTERLKNRIIDGERPGLEADLDEALNKHEALDIINNILLDGMKVVGELFGSGQMQLPFVLQSAETMKASVNYLEPHLEKIEGQSKGKIVLATVKGDVHDIGKNLVDIILTNNGYTVYNLGIKQPINTIIDKFNDVSADGIGMSGLLVKSTVIMKDNLEVLNERGIEAPVILGGAALTRSYVEQDLRRIYKGRLDYAKDAFAGLGQMDEICAGKTAPKAASAATTRGRRATDPEQVPADLPQRSAVAADNPVPTPPFWGASLISYIPLPAVLGYMNEVMLFQVQWQYKKARRGEEEFKRFIDSEVRPIYRELIERCKQENVLHPQAAYGYWPCNAEGNDLVIYDAQDQDRQITRFSFPRERKAPYRCIADYFRSVDSGEKDVVALSVVTMGPRVGELAQQWFAADRYKDYLHLHGLGVEGAEALAEYIHKQIRVELEIADQDARDLREIFKQGYQGCRFSFGYPACPNLADQERLWPLLNPERIGVSLTEEHQLVPEQSTTAIICHHPEAMYFNAR